jgi:predicted RNA-binding Zn ribbon-like protein
MAILNEVTHHFRAEFRVIDLGMELQSETAARDILHTLDQTRIRTCGNAESYWYFYDFVVV